MAILMRLHAKQFTIASTNLLMAKTGSIATKISFNGILRISRKLLPHQHL